MNVPARRAGSTAPVVSSLALLVVGALGVTACSSSDAAAGPASGGAAASAFPTQDVVTGVAQDAALHAKLPAAVRSSGALDLGTTQLTGASGLPTAGEDSNGREIGLNVDLRNAVAKVLGVRWTKGIGTFDTIVPGVQNGKYQVGEANFGVTKARQQSVDFVTFLNSGQSFLGSKQATVSKVSSLTDICGHTVATTPGTTFQTLLNANAGKCAAAGRKPWSVKYFSTTAPIFLGLQNGTIDLFFGPTLAVRYDAKHIPDTRYLGEVTKTPVGFVTAKKSPLVPVLAAAVDRLISTGAYARIFAKWGVGGELAKAGVNPAATF